MVVIGPPSGLDQLLHRGACNTAGGTLQRSSAAIQEPSEKRAMRARRAHARLATTPREQARERRG